MRAPMRTSRTRSASTRTTWGRTTASAPSDFGDGYTIKVNMDQALGTFCFSGAKANISYDERFFVTHHHDGAKSDIILVDLMDGQSYDITNMPDGSRALFPHFRSDGWFYFLVRSGEEEYIVANDYALILGKK